MRPLGNRDARRDNIAVNRPVVADIDLVARRDVAGDLSQHDNSFCEDLRLDATVGADREHVVAQLNGPFDMALDRQILAAVQFALDDDRLPNVHDILLQSTPRLQSISRLGRTRDSSPHLSWCGRLGSSRRLSACRSDCFIAFPHLIILRQSSCRGA